MGGTRWSEEHYEERAKMRLSAAAAGRMEEATPFAYDYAVKAGTAPSRVHEKMNPKGVVFRESRDSAAHPEAIPCAYWIDVTGSVGEKNCNTFQEGLKKFMGLLIAKGYIEHPAIMTGAFGDATCDDSPLQVGQFESGIEIEDDLSRLHIEGGGGGGVTESAELALYFMARHTVHDHWEKRGRKGYVFLITDETPYDRISKAQVKEIIGDVLDQDVSVEEILAEVQQRYEVFVIIPMMASKGHLPEVQRRWKALLGQNVCLLHDVHGLCELMAAQIAVCEGTADAATVKEHLVEAGTSTAVVEAVGRALVTTGSGAPKGAVQKAPTSGAASGVSTFR